MGSPVDDALADLARVLDALDVPWFVFGAQAAIMYGSTRVTEDIDVTVDIAGRTTSRKLVAALRRAGFRLRVPDTGGFVTLTRVLPIVHSETQIPVDIVLAGPGLEETFMERRRLHARAGLDVPVASPEDLIVMKVLAGRPRDREDIRAVLRGVGDEMDLRRIRTTLGMLEGALGQSDLLPSFETLVAGTRRRRRPTTKRRSASKSAKRR